MPETNSETRIQLEYKDKITATVIQKAITPDNIGTPEGIHLTTHVEQNILTIEVITNRSIGSLVSTLDDLLSCIQVAEKSLENII